MTMKFECKKCRKEHEMSCAELDWELVDDADPDREMGPESHYTASWESFCDNCGNNMTIEFSCWEYPQGVIEVEDDPNTQGIKLLPDEETCCINVESEEENNEEEPF